MREVCRELITCADDREILWYRLYADDLVLIIPVQYLERLLKTLVEVSEHYNLKLNPKKSAIMAIKGHAKIEGEEEKLHGIPIVDTYCYLGVNIDRYGSLEPHIDAVLKRSNYLRTHMRYYVN